MKKLAIIAVLALSLTACQSKIDREATEQFKLREEIRTRSVLRDEKIATLTAELGKLQQEAVEDQQKIEQVEANPLYQAKLYIEQQKAPAGGPSLGKQAE